METLSASDANDLGPAGNRYLFGLALGVQGKQFEGDFAPILVERDESIALKAVGLGRQGELVAEAIAMIPGSLDTGNRAVLCGRTRIPGSILWRREGGQRKLPRAVSPSVNPVLQDRSIVNVSGDQDRL